MKRFRKIYFFALMGAFGGFTAAALHQILLLGIFAPLMSSLDPAHLLCDPRRGDRGADWFFPKLHGRSEPSIPGGEHCAPELQADCWGPWAGVWQFPFPKSCTIISAAAFWDVPAQSVCWAWLSASRKGRTEARAGGAVLQGGLREESSRALCSRSCSSDRARIPMARSSRSFSWSLDLIVHIAIR